MRLMASIHLINWPERGVRRGLDSSRQRDGEGEIINATG